MMRYYLAYGSNLNKEQMARRCPDALPVCKYTMCGYELVFRRGFLTIEPNESAEVPCVIWQISEHDEKNLDRYEGFPKFYRKERFLAMIPDPEELTGRMITAMAYVMNEGHPIQAPSDGYLTVCRIGYKEFGLDMTPLMVAYERAKWPDDE